jgi:hypothetical protein
MKKLLIVLVLILLVFFIFFLIDNKLFYSDTNPILDKVRYNFTLIKPEYGNIPLREGNAAYTENKTSITLCLKNPQNNQYYDMNTIMYVALHELAHMVSKSRGKGDEHNAEFRENFAVLLEKGQNLGFYNPSKPMPSTYCGVTS